MKRISRTIAELPAILTKPWMCRETGTRYKTATGALNAIKREASKMAETGTPSAFEISWVTTTDAGYKIVKGIQ